MPSLQELGISIKWEGSGEKEVGRNVANGEVIVAIDAKYVIDRLRRIFGFIFLFHAIDSSIPYLGTIGRRRSISYLVILPKLRRS